MVEFVASGSRFRIYIPKTNSLATFLLGGISCPRAARPATGNLPASEGEEYGDEALLFVKEKCLQREVSIQVDTHDKAGNFIGWLWIDNLNLSVELVRAGFASVHFTGEKSSYASQVIFCFAFFLLKSRIMGFRRVNELSSDLTCSEIS